MLQTLLMAIQSLHVIHLRENAFPLGLNQVKCTATDKSGNKAEAHLVLL